MGFKVGRRHPSKLARRHRAAIDRLCYDRWGRLSPRERSRRLKSLFRLYERDLEGITKLLMRGDATACWVDVRDLSEAVARLGLQMAVDFQKLALIG